MVIERSKDQEILWQVQENSQPRREFVWGFLLTFTKSNASHLMSVSVINTIDN